MKKPDQRKRLNLPTSIRGLEDLASNYWWAWNADARTLFEELARAAGGRARREPMSPIAVLGALSSADFRRLAADGDFLKRYREIQRRFREDCRYTARPFQKKSALITARSPVAYLSMEYALDSSLPIYAGGLGILSGDHLKSASDLGAPLVALGLAYREGYFRQLIDRRGKQSVVYPRLDYGDVGLSLLRDPAGKERRVSVTLAANTSAGKARRVQIRVWQLGVGRTTAYLLDTDIAANTPWVRRLSHRLYGGTREQRVAQEVILGVGGVRLLRALGIQPAVWHLNEGHVAFSALERIRELMTGGARSRRLDFFEALELVAADTVFTTHTPVTEGNEVFDLQLARRYLEPLVKGTDLSVDEFLELGLDWNASGQPILSMTVLAMRVSRFRNGVSRLHGEVARGMWSRLWPGFSPVETPVGSVTNGIHTPTWIAPEMADHFSRVVGANWRKRQTDPAVWKRVSRISDRALWETRNVLRERLVHFVRERVREQLVRNGRAAKKARDATADLLDPSCFTIGFARRFALYKRALLLFSDRRRARALLSNRKRPVQIIFAGKPHPEDPEGKKLFEAAIALSRKAEFRGRVVVLENYNMDVGRAMVQGVDLWLNNPRRPQEASGTSGQKVPINGGLNASVLDGWWDEAYTPDVGWAIGKARDYGDLDLQDREDSASLYTVLEKKVVPLFYRRGSDGLPREWLRRVKRSMAELIPKFNTDTMVSNYIDELYVPAARLGQRLGAKNARLARELSAWRQSVACSWPMVHVLNVYREHRRGGQKIIAEFFLAGLSARDISARLESSQDALEPVHFRPTADGALRIEFQAGRSFPGRFKLRIWPMHPALAHESELGLSYEVEAV